MLGVGDGEHVDGDVDADHHTAPSDRGAPDRQGPPGAATDVEDAGAGCDAELFDDPGERGGVVREAVVPRPGAGSEEGLGCLERPPGRIRSRRLRRVLDGPIGRRRVVGQLRTRFLKPLIPK
jgi:hypothetical protein